MATLPRRVRGKTRVQHLAESLEALQKARNAAGAVDLRTTRGDLRDTVRRLRSQLDEAHATALLALQQDAPVPPTRVMREG